MNTEELKIIMDALVSLGEAGKSGFIWWLVMKYGLHYLAVLSAIVLAFLAVRAILTKIIDANYGNLLAEELCQIMNVKKHGSYGWDNEVFRPELKADIITKVRELMEARK